MEPESVWKERWESATLPMARQYMELATQKQSLVCLAADRPTMKELNDLLDAVHPFIVALKTHVDMVDDWTSEDWKAFCKKANHLGLLIFEDRKFADIGKISEKQMLGLYNIASWSDLVTAHLISGPDIVDGIQAAWEGKGRSGGVLLLAQRAQSAAAEASVGRGARGRGEPGEQRDGGHLRPWRTELCESFYPV